MTPHPTRDELTAFQAGQLAPARSRDIDAHLDECDECRAALPPRDLTPIDDPPPHLPPGYEFIERIGSGGMGVVYRARRIADGLEFAIKTLLPQHRGNAVLAGYLEREAAITARLRHLRVLNGAQLRRYSATDPTPFIEFPWVPGTTLAKMIGTPLARENPLRLVQWVIQCCKAVEAAHRHEPPIIHFDLKPENLLIYDRDGEAVLIDFGLASEWPPPPDSEPRSGSGTPAYMAPEVADGGRRSLIGPATDVFAIGGMLCAILTGHPPYSKADFPGPGEVREAARRYDLGPAMKWLDACREYPALVAFTKRCLSLEPANRPADAGEVWRELETLVSSATRQRHQRVPPRRWWFLVTAGFVAGILPVVALLLLRERPPTPDELLTAGPWARYIQFRPWTEDELARIHARYPGRFVGKDGKPVPPLDSHGNSYIHADVGCYPLVKFHRPEWVESVTLSHDAIIDHVPPHFSDFTFVLPPLPGALVEVPLPTAPGWAKAVNGDRACKKPLTVCFAFTNGQYVFPPVFAAGGVIVPTEDRFAYPGAVLTGINKDARGGGNSAYIGLAGVRSQWDRAKKVMLHVKVRGVPEVYEYDLQPSILGWEPTIRDSEAD